MTDKQNFEKDIDVPSKLLDSNLTRADLCILINDLHIERIGKNKQLKAKEQRIVELNKTIQAKEQECEELKKGYSELTEIVSPYMDDFTGYNEELGGFDIVLCVKQLLEQLDQLKAENEELTTINTRLLGRLEVNETDTSLVFKLDKELRQKGKEFYTAIQKVVKLKQTLIEIKKIAKPYNDMSGNCVIVNFFKDMNEILQKISEVEQ